MEKSTLKTARKSTEKSAKIEKRKLGGVSGEVSLLGYGCMRLPTMQAGKAAIDVKAAEKLIGYAFEHGVNYFDTAWPYHEGESEVFIGNALSNFAREKFFLADKLPNWLVKKPADTDEYFEKQLKKCNVEYFDFYLVHALNKRGFEKMLENGVYENLLQKKAEGRIRHLGFSFHDHPMLIKKIVEGRQWDFAQIQLNYLDWLDYGSRFMYNHLAKNGIPVIVMEPVRGGALASLSEGAAKILKDNSPDSSLASWALRYAGSLKNVLTVLSGMSNQEQLTDNVATFTGFKPLSANERKVLDLAVAEYRKADTIKCTGCRYCMDCGFGVDIPLIFSIYNQYRISGNAAQFLKNYHGLSDSSKVSNCTSCGACVAKCPQGLDVFNLLKTVEKRAKNIGG